MHTKMVDITIDMPQANHTLLLSQVGTKVTEGHKEGHSWWHSEQEKGTK